MAPKKGGPQEKVEAHTVLTAVVLADSFTQVINEFQSRYSKAQSTNKRSHTSGNISACQPAGIPSRDKARPHSQQD